MASTDTEMTYWPEPSDSTLSFDNATNGVGGGSADLSDQLDSIRYVDRSRVDAWTAVVSAVHLLICVGGLVGNTCVIVVVLRYTKTKTVTNMYIANLAVADLCFVVGLPLLVVTSILERWIFGAVACRLFMVSSSINWFTSVFTLTVMSVDRYLAVCWPVASLRYRTPAVARFVCAGVWALSMLAMVPIALYATTTRQSSQAVDGGAPERWTCTIIWPNNELIPPETAFIWYGFTLAFAGPFALISVFYLLVVLRLRTVGPNRNRNRTTGGPARSHFRVTALVLTVIAVYVFCWLPYWIFQVSLSLMTSHALSPPELIAFHVITMLSYANSTLNPLLYAAFNENFRNGFKRAFGCGGRAGPRASAAGRSFTDRQRPTMGDAGLDGDTSCRGGDRKRGKSGAGTKATTAMTVAESEAEMEPGWPPTTVAESEAEMEIGSPTDGLDHRVVVGGGAGHLAVWSGGNGTVADAIRLEVQQRDDENPEPEVDGAALNGGNSTPAAELIEETSM